jgi:hypothetical protein
MTDFNRLKTLLLAATRQAFTTVQAQHPDEQFYGFGLFHAPLWHYICPTCNTEEGLTRTAEKYQLKYPQYYEQQTIESLKQDVRWSPADWFYHLAGKEFFEPVNAWLLKHDIYNASSEPWEAWVEAIRLPMYALCRDVLRTLDKERLFGDTDTRQRIVLNIMMGDQDNSWLEHARLLNPPEVYARWLSEIS